MNEDTQKLIAIMICICSPRHGGTGMEYCPECGNPLFCLVCGGCRGCARIAEVEAEKLEEERVAQAKLQRTAGPRKPRRR